MGLDVTGDLDVRIVLGVAAWLSANSQPVDYDDLQIPRPRRDLRADLPTCLSTCSQCSSLAWSAWLWPCPAPGPAATARLSPLQPGAMAMFVVDDSRDVLSLDASDPLGSVAEPDRVETESQRGRECPYAEIHPVTT